MLHVVLGNVKKLHEMLEGDLHYLDTEILTSLKKSQLPRDDKKLSKFLENQSKLLDLTTKHTKVVQQLYELQESDEDDMVLSLLRGRKQQIDSLKTEAADYEKDIKKLQKELKLSQGIGPMCKYLESSLQKHKIERQRYHGRSFIGMFTFNTGYSFVGFNLRNTFWCDS